FRACARRRPAVTSSRDDAAGSGGRGMMSGSAPLFVVVYLASAVLALYGFERGRPRMVVVFKPLTTALLLPIIGLPTSAFQALAWAGVLASIVGDAAL